MASRWGAGGDETLTISTMDLFSSNTLDEDDGMSPGETLEVFQSTLDPSILSMFEDTHSGEEESEATLLTALTEILDNVDEENLSPFDMLPDSDLLSGQKAREHSPLRRLLCLSRSPPEKDPFCNMRPFSTGKSLSRSQAASLQRSDGEEEDYGSLTPSPVRQPSSPDQELPDWGNRTLPSITLEQEGEDYDGISVSLGDLVKHMHPYCMTICVEDGLEEQMFLPEGGILLEVVDQGEHGEPILAIQDMDLSLPGPVPQNAPEMRQRVPDEEEEDAASDISEHIIVDDDDYDDTMANEALAEFARHLAPLASSEVKDEVVIKRPKEEIREKSPSRRRKKKKSKKGLKREPVEEEDVPPVEGRVLRSSSSRRAADVSPRKTAKNTIKEEKKRKESTTLCSSSLPSSLPKPRGRNGAPAETQSEVTTLTLPTKSTIKKGAEPLPPTTDQSPGNASPETSPVDSPPTPINSSQSEEMAKLSAPAADKLPVSSAVTAAVSPVPLSTTPLSPPEDSTTQLNVLPQNPLPSSESSTPPPVTAKTSDLAPPPAPESKPKSLSLAEYRRLRLEKKLVPVEKTEDHSTKWPSLPEPPKELPPIPCLPDPSPRDARRPHHHPPPSKEAEEVKTAWQPMGPGAPPTPEALLVPPAYMVAASRKVANAAAAPAPKPQPAPQDSRPRRPQGASAPTTSPSPLHATPPAAKPLVPHNSGSPPPVLRSVSVLTPAAEKLKSFSAPSKVEGVSGERPCPPQVDSAKPVLVNEGSSKTTTNPPRPTAASVFAQILKTTAMIRNRNVPLPVAATPPASDSVVTPASRPSSRPAVPGPHTAPFRVNQSSRSSAIPKETKPVALGDEGRPTAEPGALRTKSRTQELIEAFTSEIGIEAADLTSLLEQFEETQAKVEQIVPEVSGRAAAVGNSSGALTAERSAVERVRANDLSSIAALTPPATPPHQMWKPLAPVALLAKSRAATEGPPKPSPSKVIQIDARPLPAAKLRSKPTAPAPAVSPELISMDHDYCLPSKVASAAGEQGQRWNIKQQPFITIKTIKRPTTTTTQPSQMVAHRVETTTPVLDTKSPDSSLTDPLDHRTVTAAGSSVLETPDASPVSRETDDDDNDDALPEQSPRHGRSYRRHASDSRSPSPRPASKDRKRGRSSRRGSHRSPSPTSSSGSDSDDSSSSSQSRSRSPPRKRYRRRSASRSSSSSRSSSHSVSRSPPRRRRYSYSSSRSGSWSRSRSRSRSRSPWMEDGWSRGRRTSRSGYRPSVRESSEEVKRLKEKAIEERRVVYVGRIRGAMTRKELRERFSLYGEIEECTLHFRDHGDNYGFVTYYDTKNAFQAIENGGKLRKPDELPFDLCFGGRRQFCQTSYADLDSNRDSYDPSPSKANFNALDFDTLLKQAQKGLKR